MLQRHWHNLHLQHYICISIFLHCIACKNLSECSPKSFVYVKVFSFKKPVDLPNETSALPPIPD